MAEPRVLRCGVIGAGVAGLAAAVALSNAGHEVEVFERSHFKHEIGAAITICPNASLVLEHWDFDFKKTQPTNMEQSRVYGWQSLELELRDINHEIPTEYAHRIYGFHRVDLHNGIRSLAEKRGSVKIKLGAEVTKVDCEGGAISLVDGSCIQKDLVIIADGINSGLAKAVTDLDSPTQKTGRSVFRTLIPMDRLLADEEIRPLFADESPGYVFASVSDKYNLVITYPCRDNTVLNVAVFHNTNTHQEAADDWNSEATVEEALQVLEGYHEVWHKLISKADFMKVYTVGYGLVPSHIVKGKAIVIGDAAHPMLPTFAQGGAMALEDAAALEVLLTGVTSDESLEKRLHVFEQLRLPRCATTQILANAIFIPRGESKEALVRKYYQGPLFEPLDAPGFARPIRDFWYGYDVFSEAKKALEFKDVDGGVPEGALKFFETDKTAPAVGSEHLVHVT